MYFNNLYTHYGVMLANYDCTASQNCNLPSDSNSIPYIYTHRYIYKCMFRGLASQM
jgi:hypothetical protein